MRRALDLVLIALLGALVFFKLTGESWQLFPHEAPVRFHLFDLLAAALGALLLLRSSAFPGQPIPLFDRIGKALLGTPEGRVSRRRTAALFAAFFGFFLLIHVMRHWSLNTELYDLSLVHRALFRPFDGIPLRNDVGANGTFLSAHLAFTFFLLAPVTALLHSDEVVFLLQALLVVLPLWYAFSSGPLRSLSRLWPAAFLVVMCHAAIRNGLIWDFREDVLAFCFLLTAIVSVMNGRVLAYALSLALALLSKENVAFVALFLALPLLLAPDLPLSRPRRVALACGTAAVSLLWSFVSLKFLLPHFGVHGAATHDLVNYFPSLGSSPGAVVLNVLTSPRQVVALLASRLPGWDTLTYAALLFLPYSFFLGKAGWWLAPAFPGFLMNALAARPYLKHLAFHYDWVILPFLIIGLMKGIERAAAKEGGISLRAWSSALIVAFAFSGTWPVERYWVRFLPSRLRVREALYLRGLPTEGVLAVARSEAVAQLSRVREIRLLAPPPYDGFGDRARYWDGFWARNALDGTEIPGHGAREATRMLLDLRDPAQSAIAAEAPRRGWKAVSMSPSGTFVHYLRS